MVVKAVDKRCTINSVEPSTAMRIPTECNQPCLNPFQGADMYPVRYFFKCVQEHLGQPEPRRIRVKDQAQMMNI